MSGSPIRPLDRACVLLGLEPAEAAAFLDGRYEPCAADEQALVSCARQTTCGTFDRLRAEPNRVRCDAWTRLVGDAAPRVLAARPFYSLAEIAVVAGLPKAVVEDLFAFEPRSFVDRPTGATVTLEPEGGRYVIEASDFESASLSDAWDLRAVGPRLRVAAPLEFERGPSRAGLEALKQAHRGRLMPVLRDAQGRARFFAPRMLVVGFEPGADTVQALAAAGVERVRTYAEQGLVLARARPSDDSLGAVLAAVAVLNGFSGVRFAEPEQFGIDDWAPPIDLPAGDFESIGRYWNHDAIGLAAAHRWTRGDAAVTVFVVDSGLETDHPQLRNALRPGWTELDLSFDLDEPLDATSPRGVIPHGTQVAGVVAGQGDGDDPVLGVAPGCRIVPVKIPGRRGGTGSPGWGLRAAAILSMLDELAEGERAVLNVSWRTSAPSIAIREALADAAARDVVVVMSAGNYPPWAHQEADAAHFPSFHADARPSSASTPRLAHLARCALSVGALGAGDRKASYSYYGAHSVSLFAPGGELGGEGSGVFTTTLGGRTGFTAGTSFACPHVAGVAALVRSAAPSMSAPRVVDTLQETTRPLDASNPAYVGLLGRGGLDAAAALERASGGAQPSTPSGPGRLNINLASAEAFERLDVVGPYRARVFVQHRERFGPYESVFGLLDTGVIDPWALGLVRDHITV